MHRVAGAAAAGLLRGAALLLAMACACLPAALAQSPLPQPRVAHDMHSARINQIRATPDGTRLLSVSEDKTVRIWRLADLALLRTLRTPSEPGTEGALRALAVAPDSQSVIVGGWTGLAWSGRAHLYRYELATGRMSVLPADFESLIQALGISPDGRWLAVGLDRGGLRVVDLGTGQAVPARADADYGAHVRFTEFGPDGTLATTSQDGCLRLYAPDGRRSFRNQYVAGGPPASGAVCTGSAMGGVRFSPDGQRLAWGQNERSELVVMRLAGQVIERVIGSSDAQQRSLCCANFSADGRQLYYHGAHDGPGATPLYRADLATPDAAPTRLDVGRQRFTNVLPLPGGDVVFSTDAPSLVRISAQGAVQARVEPPNIDFRFDSTRFRLSADGRSVVFPRDGASGPDWAFAPLAGPAAALQPLSATTAAKPPTGLAPALRSGGRLALQAGLDEFSHLQPRSINGHPLQLQANQATRSWAAHATLPVLAVGTQWSVLLADAQARVLWEQVLPAPALQVVISADGRWVVAAVADGTLRWYTRDGGQEALAAFVHQRQPEWVAWRPDGHYTASTLGDQFFGWQLNRGSAREPDFLRAVQFERQLFRPDLVAAALQPGSAAAPGGGPEALARVLQAAGVPRVRVAAVQETPRGSLALTVQVEGNGRPVQELGIFVDGLPALPAAARAVQVAADGRAELRYEVPRLGPLGRVRVEAETAASIGDDETQAAVRAGTTTTAPPGRLWLLLVGSSVFDHLGPDSALPGALNDAAALARTLAALPPGAHSGVDLQLLSSGAARRPTKANILAALAGLAQRVQPADTVLVFVASHGMPDAGEYYILTQDSTADDATRVERAAQRGERVAPGSAASLISGTELVEAMRRLPGRRIVVLDTCYAGLAGNGSDPFVLVKRSASAQLAVVSAASGDELSLESRELGHGIFSYMLMKALRREIGPASGPLTVRALFDAVKPAVVAEVARLRQAQATPAARARIGPQTPVMTAIPALEDAVLVVQR